MRVHVVSLAAGCTAAALAGWMAVMRFLPEFSGVRRSDVNKWLVLDSFEFTALVGLASTAHRRPVRARKWALGGTLLILGDAVVDVATSQPGRERRQAMVMATLVELPCAIALGSWALTRH